MRLLRFFKRELGRDIEQWVTDGLISVEQATGICARYDLVYGEHTGKSRAYATLMFLGFAFIGLAVITLLGANWEHIPRSIRVGGLFSATLMCNAVAIRLFITDKHRAATGMFLLGGGLYGASIMLIGQMYHLGVHFADGIFWWALGVLPVALLTRSNTIMLFALSLAFTWAMVSLEMGYFPTLALIFLAGLAIHLRFNRHHLVLFLTLIGGACLYVQFGASTLLNGDRLLNLGGENVLLGFALMAIIFAMSRWLMADPLQKRQDYGVLLDVWLLRLLIVTLFIFSFDDAWRELFRANWEYPSLTLVAIILFALICMGFALLQANTQVNKQADNLIDTLWPVASAAIALVVLSAVAMFIADSSHATIFQIATNILILGLGIYLISRGLVHRITHYFFTGVATILGLAFVRYFDLIGDYIGATILFIVCASILLGVAAFWKRSLQNEEAAA